MRSRWVTLLLAWIVSMSATLGALFIGEVMLTPPCTLCWYQRIAMFPLAIVLGIGCFINDRYAAVYALPFALVGTVIAAYHSLLVADLIPASLIPCSAGISCTDQALVILGSVQIPWLSLLAFLAILGLLTHYLKNSFK